MTYSRVLANHFINDVLKCRSYQTRHITNQIQHLEKNCSDDSLKEVCSYYNITISDLKIRLKELENENTRLKIENTYKPNMFFDGLKDLDFSKDNKGLNKKYGFSFVNSYTNNSVKIYRNIESYYVHILNQLESGDNCYIQQPWFTNEKIHDLLIKKLTDGSKINIKVIYSKYHTKYNNITKVKNVNVWNRIKQLKSLGVEFRDVEFNSKGMLHNKICIILRDEKPVVTIGGSYNTSNAASNNIENIDINREQEHSYCMLQNFQHMWKIL